jgi:hypothetical protein
VVVAFSWSDKAGRRHRWAQALLVKDEKIVGIQDFASPRSARAFVRIRTAFG